MSDPFEFLRVPTAPIEPDAAFRTTLWTRLVRALALPEGASVNDLALDDPSAAPLTALITPYLAVVDASAALEWYREVLGARRRGETIVMADGRIGHAELEIGRGALMLSEEHPEIGVTAPRPGEAASVTLHLALEGVEAVDRLIARATAAGAVLERPAADYEYGRNGVIRDPFGHRWLVSAEPSGSGFVAGDIAYISLWVPDVARAAAFFAAVLGWRYGAASGPMGRRVQGYVLDHGLWGGVERPTLFCCYAVEDVDAAAERVRAAGGAAGAPHDEPFGRIAECVDPEGGDFAVFEPPGGTVATRAARGEMVEGDLAYVTMEVADSIGVRDFYRAVLGWQFAPGTAEDGWNVLGVEPMVGISGRHDHTVNVPMYRVEDIVAAVARVRLAGGEATEPELQPYGVTSICTDDQGTRFYLGQF
jgi:predicted enzyme related to lactoylglutathione lyase